MLESKTREKVLKKLRHALLHKTPEPYTQIDFDSPLLAEGDHDELPELTFARNFSEAGGRFVFCESVGALRQALAALAAERSWGPVYADDPTREHVEAAITGNEKNGHPVWVQACVALSARSGEALVAEGLHADIPPVAESGTRVLVAFVSQVYADLEEAMRQVAARYRSSPPATITALNGAPGKTKETADPSNDELFLMLVDES